MRANGKLKNQLAAALESAGCKNKLLNKAQLFIDYLVKHMTDSRLEMRRNAGITLQHHLVPYELWADSSPAAADDDASDDVELSDSDEPDEELDEDRPALLRSPANPS